MKKIFLILVIPLLPALVFPQSITGSLQQEVKKTFQDSDDETIYVIGSKEKSFFKPGSAHFIDSKDLNKFNYKDVNRVLDKVPGVYIQEEDGLGLRPNIGLRGAHPHRSKKITLMEDGVLVGPAPYSAPAAYYFPSTFRIHSIEVFKGPSSIKYGPNSIGGAINMVTAPIKEGSEVEFSAGRSTALKATTAGKNWFISGSRKSGDLIRNTKGIEDYKFEQNDFLVKYKKKKLKFKFSYSNENSDETYLGLSPQGFNNNPFTRYAASQSDNMDWDRFALQASYASKFGLNLKLNTTVYHHQMKRNWSKFSKLNGEQDFRTALRDGSNQSIISLLKGERDSADASENLIIGANDRKYYSQGIQTQFKVQADHNEIYHDLELGLRIHRDQVERNHSEIQAKMTSGELVFLNETYAPANINRDTSLAYTVFLSDEINYNDLTVVIGSRVEAISTTRETRIAGSTDLKNEDIVIVPGIGVNYSLKENIVLLGGVNKGVTIVGPGQLDTVEPESATNYEMGLRINSPFNFEAIGFYSDYQNIKGTCTFSGGCTEQNLDKEYNGGQADIYGLESLISYEIKTKQWLFPVKLGYTYTVAKFKEETVSDNPEWGVGKIRTGDPLPYIPQNQISAGVGANFKRFGADLNFIWKSKVADQSVAKGRKLIPSYGVIDTAFSYQYDKHGKAFVRVRNLLDNKYLVGLRPFGARPGAPRGYSIGLNQKF